MTEKVHEVERRQIRPGETIESYGFTPDEILDHEILRKDSLGTFRPCLEIWFLKETEIDPQEKMEEDHEENKEAYQKMGEVDIDD